MHWIALLPPREDERVAWGWWALQFTPKVAQVDEALLLEIAGSERLFGGKKRLLNLIFQGDMPLSLAEWAPGTTSLIALALLRLKLRNQAAPAAVPDGLPLEVLTAASGCVDTLARIGCRSWGDLRRLPRGGVARRFGAGLLQALDAAHGERPEQYAWLTLPEVFDQKLELPALATSAPELMWSAQRLLSQLQVWLQARNRGVLALELEWTLDLRRLDGKPLPPTQQMQVRTAQPTQEMAHLRRLVSEHLSRATLAAPVNHLRLRSLETAPWGGIATSLLPEDNKPGEKLHEFVERLSVRLGEDNVRVARMCSDHRPERMQEWVPARTKGTGGRSIRNPLTPSLSPDGERGRTFDGGGLRDFSANRDVLYPTWLLPQPVELEIRGHTPCWGGPLRRLTRLFRVEHAWWEEGGPACRDYFIARSQEAGLVWIYRDRPERGAQSRWYLQGLYA